MYTESRNEKKGDNQKLLQALTVLLNIGVLITTAIVGWSVYSLIVRSAEIYSIISGNFLS